ncbi:MAG TPA: sigma-70 family RNA polymerase sigma factor [Cyclobacteriaceae bacterium]
MEEPLQLVELIQSCLRGNREAQKILYKSFYGYAMSICIRYALTREEAKEIVNDGFMKVFTRLVSRDEQVPFKPWLRKVMINTAIDHYRKHSKHYNHKEINETLAWIPSQQVDVIGDISYEELIKMIQQLPPAYRAVFNLYVIDGYTHEEVAEQLDISVGASKSNLFKARENLKAVLKKINVKRYA